MDVSNLNVLFMVSAFNGLSQKIWCELNICYQQTELLIGVNADVVEKINPDLILCPYMKDYIPDRIWKHYPCLIVHPGPVTDGGPSSLNWAVRDGLKKWGVTILKADKGWDLGKILATADFDLTEDSVASLYRNQVADIAIQIIPVAIENYFEKVTQIHKPPLKYKPVIKQKDLAFNWVESTSNIVRKINAGDSAPGTQGLIKGQVFKLFGASKGNRTGVPGEIIEISYDCIEIGTIDGSIKINRLASDDGIKLRPGSFEI